MYRLLISDDKFHIRKGLSMSVDWKALGFSLEGCFEDGSEVIAYMKKKEADVVFTDIEMAEVSGMDLAVWIAENRPDVIVVFISGCQEFEYARNALSAGVFEYVLKPINSEEIVRVFKKIKERLDARSEKVIEVESLSKEEAEQLLSPEYLVEKTRGFISKNINKDLGLDEIAEAVYVSKSYLVKQFKKYSGETVMECVLQMKMEKAIQMLKKGEYRPEILAAEIGYSDVRYFQRVFKNYTGYSVKEYCRLLH